MSQGLLDYARNGDAGADRLITMLAATGGLAAQRDLLTLLIGDPAHPEQRQLHELTFEEAVRVEILARFCALRGDSLDHRRLAGVLHQMAATASAADDRLAFASEAAELLRALADDGDGLASEFLAQIVAEFPEVRGALLIADAATLPAPLPRRSGEPTLGDILAEVFSQGAPAPRTGLRARLSDWAWRVRVWWWGFLDGWGK